MALLLPCWSEDTYAFISSVARQSCTFRFWGGDYALGEPSTQESLSNGSDSLSLSYLDHAISKMVSAFLLKAFFSESSDFLQHKALSERRSWGAVRRRAGDRTHRRSRAVRCSPAAAVTSFTGTTARGATFSEEAHITLQPHAQSSIYWVPRLCPALCSCRGRSSEQDKSLLSLARGNRWPKERQKGGHFGRGWVLWRKVSGTMWWRDCVGNVRHGDQSSQSLGRGDIQAETRKMKRRDPSRALGTRCPRREEHMTSPEVEAGLACLPY